MNDSLEFLTPRLKVQESFPACCKFITLVNTITDQVHIINPHTLHILTVACIIISKWYMYMTTWEVTVCKYMVLLCPCRLYGYTYLLTTIVTHWWHSYSYCTQYYYTRVLLHIMFNEKLVEKPVSRATLATLIH